MIRWNSACKTRLLPSPSRCVSLSALAALTGVARRAQLPPLQTSDFYGERSPPRPSLSTFQHASPLHHLLFTHSSSLYSGTHLETSVLPPTTLRDSKR